MENKTPGIAVNKNFKCTGCGECCKIDGYIHVNKTDIKRFALHFGISVSEFKEKYVKRVPGWGNVLKGGREGPCVFLKNGKCSAYGARPVQCRTFPYWDMITSSPSEWEETKKYCPACRAMGEILIKN